MRRLTRFSGSFAAVLLMIVACSSGGSPAGPTGTLELTVSGLPAGTPALIAITGPGFGAIATQAQTYDDVAPGTYTVIAPDVAAGEDTYAAAGAGSFTVSADATTSVQIVYQQVVAPALTGSLGIDITGLPTGAAAAVTVTGPDGFSQELTASAAFDDVPVGEYNLTATDVILGDDIYTPDAPAVLLVRSDQETVGTVEYQRVLGSLVVAISGLPGGQDASVEVAGPDGFSEVVSSSTVLGGLVPGLYAVTPHHVKVGDDTRVARSLPGLEVTAGNFTVAVVEYRLPRALLYIDYPTIGSGIAPDYILPVLAGTPNAFEVHEFFGGITNAEAAAARTLAEAAIVTGNYDLVAWFSFQHLQVHSTPDGDVIAAYLEQGGRVLYSHWGPFEETFAGLYEALGAAPGGNTNWTDAEFEIEELFTTAGSALVVTNPTANLNWIFSRAMVPLAGAVSVCTFDNTSDSCAVLANDSRSLVLGFNLHAPADIGLAREFYGNAVHFLLGFAD